MICCWRSECDDFSSFSRIRTVLQHIMAYFEFRSNKIFFSDEAYFTLGGYVNKQNCRIWSSKNSQVIEERSLHPAKVIVWLDHHQFGTLWSYDNRLFCLLLKNTTWRIWGFNKTVLHAKNLSEYGVFARDSSWSRNFSSWRHQLATKFMRLDTIRLFCVRLRERPSLCR